jgi:hypothetical protein
MLLSAPVPVMVSARLVPKQEAVSWQVMVAASARLPANSTVKVIDANSRTLFLTSSTFLQQDEGKTKPTSPFMLQEQDTARGG